LSLKRMSQPSQVQAHGLGGAARDAAFGAALGATALAAAGTAPMGARLFFPRGPVAWAMGCLPSRRPGCSPPSRRISPSSSESTSATVRAAAASRDVRCLLAGGSPAGAASCATSTAGGIGGLRSVKRLSTAGLACGIQQFTLACRRKNEHLHRTVTQRKNTSPILPSLKDGGEYGRGLV
jgi:hypothetical protein